MKIIVLCAVFLVLSAKQSFGVEVNLKEPALPGNAGDNVKRNIVADYVMSLAQLNKFVHDTVYNALESAYTGTYPGSNVVPKPSRRPRRRPRRRRRPSGGNPQTVPQIMYETSPGVQQVEAVKNPVAVVGEKEKEKPKSPNCKEIPDPKIKFNEDDNDTSVVYMLNGVRLIPKTTKKYFFCTDKRRGNDDYYVVETLQTYGPNSSSSSEKIYDLKGNFKGYLSLISNFND